MALATPEDFFPVFAHPEAAGSAARRDLVAVLVFPEALCRLVASGVQWLL